MRAWSVTTKTAAEVWNLPRTRTRETQAASRPVLARDDGLRAHPPQRVDRAGPAVLDAAAGHRNDRRGVAGRGDADAGRHRLRHASRAAQGRRRRSPRAASAAAG